LRQTADGLPSVVVTFDRHPLTVVAPEAAPRLLTSLQQRIELFDSHGVDVVAILAFKEIRNLQAEEFVKEVIAGTFSARSVAVGTDFRFGRDRTGDLELLEALGPGLGFGLLRVPLLEDGGQPISSTAIRIMVAAGRVEEASRALGRPFELRGKVVPGEGRGHALGFPTANLELDQSLLIPGRGVYAAWSGVDGTHPAAVNIGVRPTFGGASEVVEVHILDFEGDLYGQELRLRFQSRIRDERAFGEVDELLTQLHLDLAETRKRLDRRSPTEQWYTP
ncbi:MAG TPA: riboflavin biosynthesis protein RibF, partial [Acidimicrobiia bacterium]